MGWHLTKTLLALFLFLSVLSGTTHADNPLPVFIGLDAEFGHKTSTSDEAIRAGILIAIDEINRAGGVLDSRPLKLLERDNRSVPARGVVNFTELAQTPDLVAVFCGKFSPVVIEVLPTIYKLKIVTLDPWAAANTVVDNGYHPNYVFRLSLRDSWAIPTMMQHLRSKGARRIGLMVPNTSWGRSNHDSANTYAANNPAIILSSVQWYNWGDDSLMKQYRAILDSNADALILVANEREGSILVKELEALPKDRLLPIASHWGISGGRFVELAGPMLQKLDFAVVQTYSFIQARGEIVERVIKGAEEILGAKGAKGIVSPVGVAHAYDLTHILARAINLAGSTDRSAIRDALEQVEHYKGLIKDYERPFTPDRHEALEESDVFMAHFMADGSIIPIH
ncbi:ABC transporter substrate-binding protein [Pseudomonadota bacterium]